jgi:ketosteroid isomerase-like protein
MAPLIPIVHRLYAAFAQRDIASILPMLADDVVWCEPENPFNPAAGTRRGHAGFLEWLKAGHESEEILSLEPREFLASETSVAVTGHSRCRARATGRSYDTDFVHLISFREGKVARFQEFFDTWAAAEAFR